MLPLGAWTTASAQGDCQNEELYPFDPTTPAADGTVTAPETLDWVCVSPKSTAELKQISGDELIALGILRRREELLSALPNSIIRVSEQPPTHAGAEIGNRNRVRLHAIEKNPGPRRSSQ